MMSIPLLLCERCASTGVDTLADFVYQSEETILAGTMLGDPDCWPTDSIGQRYLCAKHYALLLADSRLDYVPAESRPGQFA